MPTLSPQSVRRLSRSPTFARSPARSKQVKALLASYSRPPHRRNLFFRAVETAAAQETAVLETHRFLRAPTQETRTHTHTPRASHAPLVAIPPDDSAASVCGEVSPLPFTSKGV